MTLSVWNSLFWKWKVKVKSLSRVLLLATPWTTAYQAPPSMRFSRREYWSGVPLPSPLVNYFSIESVIFFGVFREAEIPICFKVLGEKFPNKHFLSFLLVMWLMFVIVVCFPMRKWNELWIWILNFLLMTDFPSQNGGKYFVAVVCLFLSSWLIFYFC